MFLFMYTVVKTCLLLIVCFIWLRRIRLASYHNTNVRMYIQ